MRLTYTSKQNTKRKIMSKDEEQLFYAIEGNNADVISRLLSYGVDVNHIFIGACPLAKSHWSALHICCEKGRYECCKVLLEAGADPNIPDKYGQTPLMYAVSTGWRHITQLLLGHGADVTSRDMTGGTVMHVGAKCEDVRIIECLIQHGGNINKSDNAGRTPLWIAASDDVDVDIMSCIVKYITPESLNLRDTRRGRNALQAAIMTTNKHLLEKMEVLVNNGIDMTGTDLNHHSPFMNVIQRWYESSAKERMTTHLAETLTSCFKLLIAMGYDVNMKTAGTRKFDHDGSAVHLATKLGVSDALQLIIDLGGDVSLKNSKGLTPLHTAARHWNVDAAKVLLENGCHATNTCVFTFGEKTFFGTAFRHALECGGYHFALFLLDAGYDLCIESYLTDKNEVPEVLLRNKTLLQMLKHVKQSRDIGNVEKLYNKCVRYIRYCFGSKVESEGERLPLPRYLKDQLCLRDVLQER